ncbi:MAG TPA: alpha-glucosidase [Verrucomicrobiae bacterium]|nr:alpha-glucosidase [Verrucomicrobiae bacterium]
MVFRLAILAFLVLVALLVLPRLFARRPAPTEPPAAAREWWQDAVFYEVYPRSFADSNDDGIGDIPGITAHLDYLHDLGVNAIWITPCFPSPQVDFGYDVSDYENIDPMYGTLADMDHLIAEAKKRDMHVILDFVMNHTSDQHPWFLDSKSSRTSAHRDWYIWRDGKGPGQPPNNWMSVFGGSAWQFDPTTGQYYYHYFYPQQPDLNWRNPAVEKAMFDAVRFWYKRGISGFRLDAVDTLFEDPNLHDNPVLPGKNQFGDPNMVEKYNAKLPEVHDVLRQLRAVSNEYHAVLIGETWTKTISELKAYYGGHGDELQMPMDFLFTTVPTLSATEFRRQIEGVNAAGWPVYVVSNHDIVRSYTRWGDGVHNDQIAKVVAAMYLTLRGTPIMYYGEEIGMKNTDPTSKDQVKDPIGIRGWPKEKGRDGERTPMQWADAPNGGFSTVKPWLPVPPTYKTHNVATELQEPDSILNFYKRILALRRSEPAFVEGSWIAVNEDDPNVLAYLRRSAKQTILVVLNMSAAPHTIQLKLRKQGLASARAMTLLTTLADPPVSVSGSISLDPYAVWIASVSR